MGEKIFLKFLEKAFTYFFVFNFFGGWILIEEWVGIYVAILIIIVFFALYNSFNEIAGVMQSDFERNHQQKIVELKNYYQREILKNNQLIEEVLKEREQVGQLNNKVKILEEDGVFSNNRLNSIIRESNKIKEERDIYKESLLEKNKFFPTLLGAIEEYVAERDGEVEGYLKYKKNPSIKGAEVVKEQAQKRRQAEKDLKKANLLIEYYEAMAPFLVELKEDLAIPDENVLEDYSEEEQSDFVTKYLSKEEYRKLPSVERNQMALDRFWKKPNKSNWLLGLLYERYIGYLYEKQGYSVKYHGAKEGKKDLGRDLICEKGNEIIIVQCKYWAKFKTIHEKHVFQLFGTFFQYKYQFEKEESNKKVKAVFYTSTSLSDIARTFAKELDIEVNENIKLDREYPCIKCNIGRISDEKIYHLPFDQQYDNLVIEPKRGEFYCCTAKEAEDAGFRRAFRYKGNGKGK